MKWTADSKCGVQPVTHEGCGIGDASVSSWTMRSFNCVKLASLGIEGSAGAKEVKFNQMCCL
jgi:hypothetical protein